MPIGIERPLGICPSQELVYDGVEDMRGLASCHRAPPRGPSRPPNSKFPTVPNRVDKGTEFVSRDLDLWAHQRNVSFDFLRPGKPTDNSLIESLNGNFRRECLNAHWFMTLDDARAKCEALRKYYNEARPHSATGYNSPIALVNRSGAHGPP